MTGAKINGVIVPIDRIPQNGDIIEIITQGNSKGPSRDWLKIVKTGQARSKIRQWFKKEKRTENIEMGKSEVERELRRLNKNITDAQIEDLILAAARRVGIQTTDDFYNTLGFGGLSLQRFLPKIKEEIEKLYAPEEASLTQKDELSKIKLTNLQKKRTSTGGIVIEGEGGYQVKFAKCCNPLPGDDVIGFITRGFGVSIHKLDCHNVAESRKNEENLARWVKAAWENEEFNSSENYEASLQIITEDGIGIIASISMALADMRVSISSINTQTLKNGTVAINLSIGCRNTSHFESIVSRLRSLKSVINVTRGFAN